MRGLAEAAVTEENLYYTVRIQTALARGDEDAAEDFVHLRDTSNPVENSGRLSLNTPRMVTAAD